MKIQRNVGENRGWIFNDGSVPIQITIKCSNKIIAAEHLHKSMHEYFYILQGSMKISINGSDIKLTKDDILVVEPGERHIVTDKSEDLIVLLLMPPPVPDDKVLFQAKVG